MRLLIFTLVSRGIHVLKSIQRTAETKAAPKHEAISQAHSHNLRRYHESGNLYDPWFSRDELIPAVPAVDMGPNLGDST